MKTLFISILTATIFATASLSVQAASPWDFEYWFTPTGNENTPDGVNLRVGAGGPNLGGGQGNGGGNGGGNNNGSGFGGVDPVVTGSPRNVNQPTTTTQTFESQWVAFAGIDLDSGGEGQIAGAHRTQALTGTVEVRDATGVRNNNKGIRNNGKLTFTFGKVSDAVDPNAETNTRTLATRGKVPLITSVDDDNKAKGQINGFLRRTRVQTGIRSFEGDGANKPGAGTFTTTGDDPILIEFINDGQVAGVAQAQNNLNLKPQGDLQVYGVQGQIKDTSERKNGFGRTNFFVPEGITGKERKSELTYKYFAGYTTSSADIAKLAANTNTVIGRYSGRNSIYNINNVNINFSNGTWGGKFEHNSGHKSLNLEIADGAGTITGNRFTASTANNSIAGSNSIQSANVIGNIIGSEAQRAIGATTATYTNAAPQGFAGKTEQSVFSLSKGGIGDTN